MEVEEEILVSKEKVLSFLDNKEIWLSSIETSISDSDFEKHVTEFQQEIYNWNICQAILSREFFCFLEDVSLPILLSIYKKLLNINGSYMTFLFSSWDYVYTWASPEVHLEVDSEKVVKKPIAWTMLKKIKTFVKKI